MAADTMAYDSDLFLLELVLANAYVSNTLARKVSNDQTAAAASLPDLSLLPLRCIETLSVLAHEEISDNRGHQRQFIP